MKRRNFSADFKAKIAKAALRNDRTIREIASQFDVHPMVITKWKKQAIEALPSAFEGKRTQRKHDDDDEKRKLYEEIGKLKMQLDWVKKKCGIES